MFVNGKVIVSGTVNGHLTIVSPNEITIGDDITYANDPSRCAMTISESSLVRTSSWRTTCCCRRWRRWVLMPDKVVHLGSGSSVYVNASILALGSFGVQDYDQGVPAG